MKKELDLFFNPKTIAIIGASDAPGHIGHTLIKRNSGFKGKIIPITKEGNKILRKKSYKSVLDYSKKIDLAVIVIPAKYVLKEVRECAKKKIKNVIIISSGFSEQGNTKLQEKLLKLQKKYELNILGPNCFGISNPSKNLDLTFAKEKSKKGSTVLISQSGAMASYINDFKIGLRAFISLGNMMDLDFSDWIEYFDKDKKTKRIVLYIESLKEGRRFVEICKNSKKEIIVVKSGKSEKGKKATMSHTGSLGTDEKIYSGAFSQAKVKQQKYMIKAFGKNIDNIFPKLRGKKIAIITNGGGAGVLLTDRLTEKGYEIYGPKDVLGDASPNDYKRALNNIKRDYDNILVVLTPQTMTDVEGIARIINSSRHKKKIIACFFGERSIEKSRKFLAENGIELITKCI